MKNKYIQQALDYAKTHDLATMPVGRIVIDGENLWLNIVETQLQTYEEAKLEAHDKYIDIQIPLSGSESFGIKERTFCVKPIGEFDCSNDIVFFDDEFDDKKTIAAGEMIGIYSRNSSCSLNWGWQNKKSYIQGFEHINILNFYNYENCSTFNGSRKQHPQRQECPACTWSSTLSVSCIGSQEM